ncbi:MAG: ParB N-terminal domain-containing protein [Candidatus Shapirobacteria bacterium]|jgi:hypothetical protein
MSDRSLVENPSAFRPPSDVIGEITAANQKLPYIPYQEFAQADGLFSTDNFEGQGTQGIPSDLIVGGQSLTSWADVDHFIQSDPARFQDIYDSIRANGFDPHQPVNLFEWGGLYFVHSGQRRTMIAKTLGIDQIPARVIHVQPTIVNLPDSLWYQKMVDRQQQGLWDGTLSLKLGQEGEYQDGQAQVNQSEGVWVFANHMEEVKDIYQRLGASGQPTSVI